MKRKKMNLAAARDYRGLYAAYPTKDFALLVAFALISALFAVDVI